MRTTVVFSLAAVLVGLAPSAVRGQSSVGGLRVPPPPQVGLEAPAIQLDSRAFRGLFNVPRPTAEPSLLPARRVAPAPRVVCGMRLIPGYDTLDPGIVAPRQRPNDQHHIRSIEPTICR